MAKKDKRAKAKAGGGKRKASKALAVVAEISSAAR